MPDEASSSGVESTDVIHWQDGVSCPNRGCINPPEHGVFASYFETGAVTCAGCGEPFDLWAQACDILKTWPRDWVAFRLLGAIVTRKSVVLEPERNTEVDLNEVPADAEILSVRAMVMGPPEGQPVFPALKLFQGEMRLDPFPRHFLFYGMTHGRAEVAATSVWLSVTWIQPDEDEISVHHLADAAKQFAAGRFKGMIIPANVAVEAALTPAVTAWVRTYCSGEETKEFLGPRGATYAHQLKVLSKIASQTLGIKPMPDRIRALLNQLRQYRNDLGHNGTLNNPDRPPPNLEKAADFLTAAIFGYQYARYLHSRVAGPVPAATAG